MSDACPLQAFEESHPFAGKMASEDIEPTRRESINMLAALGRGMGLLEQTVHDSVQILDRLVRRGIGARNLVSPVLLAAIALIAAHQGSCIAPWSQHRTVGTDLLKLLCIVSMREGGKHCLMYICSQLHSISKVLIAPCAACDPLSAIACTLLKPCKFSHAPMP